MTLDVPSQEDVQQRLSQALATLFEHEKHLIDTGANERSITHHLANCIAEHFNGWHVDVEYNRNVNDPKRLDLPRRGTKDDDIRARTIYPDVIVHRRHTNEENLLVVEVKTDANADLDDDRKKLCAFTRPLADGFGLGYMFGALVVLKPQSIEWYTNGCSLGRSVCEP